MINKTKKTTKMELSNALAMLSEADLRRRKDDVMSDIIAEEWGPVMEWIDTARGGLDLAIELTQDEYAPWDVAYTPDGGLLDPEKLLMRSKSDPDVVLSMVDGTIMVSATLIQHTWERYTRKPLKCTPYNNPPRFAEEVARRTNTRAVQVGPDSLALIIHSASNTLTNFLTTTARRIKEQLEENETEIDS